MLANEFMNYVNKQGEDDCWPWLGSDNGRGYGRLLFEGRYQQAHRVSYKIHVESFPEELRVLHTCDNPACVNPKHLFLGSQQDNVDDMVAKGRDSFGGERTPNGANSPLALLNDDEVREIKKLLAKGHTHSLIAEWFGVKRQTITNISTGHRWSHVI